MAVASTDTLDREQRLDEVIIAYFEAVEAGERPDRKEWLDRYVELALSWPSSSPIRTRSAAGPGRCARRHGGRRRPASRTRNGPWIRKRARRPPCPWARSAPTSCSARSAPAAST